MVDVAPNYELNTPNAGSIVSTSSFPDYPPPSGSVLRPSNNVDQANVIVALTILAVVGMICVTASVMLTRRSTIVTRWGEFATMTYYPDLFPANAVPRDRRRRVRVPRIWDVIVAPGGSGSVEESKRYEQWEDIKPLSARATRRIQKPSATSPTTLPPDVSPHERKIRVSVIIALPCKEAGSISELAIGTADLPMLYEIKHNKVESELYRMYAP